MARGRKAEPVKLKVLKGTAREGRIRKDHPDAAGGKPTPPVWLHEDALEHFETIRARLAEIGLESTTYTETMALAAMRMAEIIACNEFLTLHGTAYLSITKHEGDMWRAYPQVAQRAEASRHLHGLLASLGLTPADIGKVGGKKREDKPESPFGQFGGKRG